MLNALFTPERAAHWQQAYDAAAVQNLANWRAAYFALTMAAAFAFYCIGTIQERAAGPRATVAASPQSSPLWPLPSPTK